MAGTLPGIPLSQQFSAIGQPLAGCLLYIYAANTTTPQDSFLDQGLTIKNPWPLAGDNSGRVPMFYLADGSVHVRLTDATGVVQFDYPSMLVIGPSSGTGGPPVSVDPTTVFQTGDVMWLDVEGTRAGWVRDNGRTISDAGKGGSERAQGDCQALFIFLWNTYSSPFANLVCPVIPGLGASASADWSNGKQITLPDKRGYSPAGSTAMGNTDNSALAGVPFTIGSSFNAAAKGGEATHLLTSGETAAHTHSFTGSALAPHSHGPSGGGSFVTFVSAAGQLGGSGITVGNPTTTTSDSAGTPAGAIGTGGVTPAGGSPHNNTGLVVMGTFFRKL